MNDTTKLVLKALNYLVWVSQPRSTKAIDIRDKLQVDIYLALNPIESNTEQKIKDALEEKKLKRPVISQKEAKE